MAKIIVLKHNDLVILNGKRGTVGTVGGYAAENNENPAVAIARNKQFGLEMPYSHYPLYWINQQGSMICADKGYYERENAKWANAIILSHGDTVWLENELLTVIYKGDFSDMGWFETLHQSRIPQNLQRGGIMKPYGVERFRDTHNPDKADIKRYGFSTSDRCSRADRGKNESRRIWAKRARKQGKALCRLEV